MDDEKLKALLTDEIGRPAGASFIGRGGAAVCIRRLAPRTAELLALLAVRVRMDRIRQRASRQFAQRLVNVQPSHNRHVQGQSTTNLLQVAKTFATEDMALAYLDQRSAGRTGVRCLVLREPQGLPPSTTKGKTGPPVPPVRVLPIAGCTSPLRRAPCSMTRTCRCTKWFAAMALMAEAKKGISANQVARHIGVHLQDGVVSLPPHPQGDGRTEWLPLWAAQGKIVEVDETFVGGKKLRKGVKGWQGRQDRRPRHCRTWWTCSPANHRKHAKQLAIRPVLEANLTPDTDKIVTDSAPVYSCYHAEEISTRKPIHKQELRDVRRYHSAPEQLKPRFRLFKRGMVGSYHKMSRDHMDALFTGVLLALQSPPHATADVRYVAAQTDQAEAAHLQETNAGDFLGFDFFGAAFTSECGVGGVAIIFRRSASNLSLSTFVLVWCFPVVVSTVNRISSF